MFKAAKTSMSFWFAEFRLALPIITKIFFLLVISNCLLIVCLLCLPLPAHAFMQAGKYNSRSSRPKHFSFSRSQNRAWKSPFTRLLLFSQYITPFCQWTNKPLFNSTMLWYLSNTAFLLLNRNFSSTHRLISTFKYKNTLAAIRLPNLL